MMKHLPSQALDGDRLLISDRDRWTRYERVLSLAVGAAGGADMVRRLSLTLSH